MHESKKVATEATKIVTETEARKAPAEVTAVTKKKPAEKKRSVASTISLAKKVNYVLQCSAKPEGISYNQLVANAKNVWRYDRGGKVSDIKSMELYIKPEEGKVYYVINSDATGSFDL